MSEKHPTPWRVETRTNSDYCEYKTIVDAAGVEVTGADVHGEGCVACGAHPDLSDEAIERIVRAVNNHAELVEWLERLEWVNYHEHFCPECGRREHRGHEQDCDLAAMIAKITS